MASLLQDGLEVEGQPVTWAEVVWRKMRRRQRATQVEPNLAAASTPRPMSTPKGREARKWELLRRRRQRTATLIIACKNADTEYAALIRKAWAAIDPRACGVQATRTYSIETGEMLLLELRAEQEEAHQQAASVDLSAKPPDFQVNAR